MNTLVKEPYKDNAYEVWSNRHHTWYVLKRWQLDEGAFAQQLCLVENSIGTNSEVRNVYVNDIKRIATRIR